MSLIDFILNLAGLLLWLNWRALRVDPLIKATPGTLAGTLRRAERKKLKRWHFPAALGLLLLLRAILYWMVGAVANWTAQLDLGVVTISFRSDVFWRMLLFSGLSFAVMLAIFLIWMLLLSVLDCGDVLRRLVRMQVGRVDGWPKWVRLALPFAACAIIWWGLSWPLAHWNLIPRPPSAVSRVAQGALVGLESYLALKFAIGAVLMLHLLDCYIYFGKHPFWNGVHAVAKKLLGPLNKLPLRIFKVDFAPLIGIVLVFSLANFVQNGMKLPPWAEEHPHGQEPTPKIPGLVEFYKRTT